MSKLINNLKNEHQEILNIFEELLKIGMFSDKGIELLMSSKTKLLSHIEKEDRELYPVLYDRAKTDLLLKSTLDSFGAEMKDVTKIVLDFYDKYSLESTKKSSFIMDVSKIVISLRNRILREEIVIYKAYEELGIH